MKKYCIYKHTCINNNKVYIGQTCQTTERRWRDGEGYKKSPRFYSAIMCHGWDSFTHEIIEDNLNAQEANEREQYWIAYYNSTDLNYGYNLTEGGDSHLYTQESRNKMSDKAIKRFSNEDERKKQSERLKAAYKRDSSSWDKIKKPIKCVETGQIFNSTTEAAEWAGIVALSSFGNYFAGRSKSCGRHPITKERLHWERVENQYGSTILLKVS